MSQPRLDDARSHRPDERLLEESWSGRTDKVSGRELLVEALASCLFVAIAIPLAVVALYGHSLNVALTVALIAAYGLSSRVVKFPIGAGYLVPSYLVLVPMLLLLPPGAVPLLAAAGLVAGTFVQALTKHAQAERVLLSVSDAWHTLGPAVVLVLAGREHRPLVLALVYIAAFLAGCIVDLISATVREAAILGVDSRVQLRVIAQVWLVDLCIAPLGLIIGTQARVHDVALLALIPINGLMLMATRDRTERIAQAQRRLDLVARERTRLQMAVRRLGDALAAKLDMAALTSIVLHGSVEALDADAGRLELEGVERSHVIDVEMEQLSPALEAAVGTTLASNSLAQVERDGVWALALPLGFRSEAGSIRGTLAVARRARAFREDEQEVMCDLVERTRRAASDIILHQLLREQAQTDALTKLGNRRKLEADLTERLSGASGQRPLVLVLFDLDGFKSYNDTFGHMAGDAILARLGTKLAYAVCAQGAAYRLGGDEFCVLAAADAEELEKLVAASAGALEERGQGFAIRASYGAAVLPYEATTLEYALELADERMYAVKKGRPSQVRDQTRDVLMNIMRAKQPSLEDHSSEVGQLCVCVARRLGMSAEQLDELMRAAELHDIGKVGIPDAILDKPDALDIDEWELMRTHTLLGERILSAAPALRAVGVLVRASHERWDGTGYPDGLVGSEIPMGARIIAACDAYEAMTTDRSYRPAGSHASACAELRRAAGTQFDPQVVEVLLDVLRAGARSAAAGRPGAANSDADARLPREVAAYLRKVMHEGNGGSLSGARGAAPEIRVRSGNDHALSDAERP